MTEDLNVFLRTFEQATCGQGLDCRYKWLDDSSLPNLSTYSVAFNTQINDYQLTLSGSFGSISATDVTFIIDGTKQTVASASSS
jgi:hypothetical protein